MRRRIAVLAAGLALLGAAGVARAAEIEPRSAQRIKLTDQRLMVSGLPWFAENQPSLARLPLRLKESFRKELWAVAEYPSGGRIRFRTDSRTVEIKATAKPRPMNDMPLTGACGFDLYVDGIYAGDAVPDSAGRVANLRREGPWFVGHTREMRDITLYLPLYTTASVEEIWVEPGARIEPSSPFAVRNPVVFYGSSLTMGACAANPGVAYPALVARRLNVDFVNLGFAGQGGGDEAVASAMAEIACSAVVLDHWADPPVEDYARSLPVFVDALRAKFPKTPILITTPCYEPISDRLGMGAVETEGKRRAAVEFVKARQAAGDACIFCVDGGEMISKDTAYGLIDARHCNSIGFYFCASGIEPHLRKALGLEAPK